jgi:prevent-host-death family protein
MLVVEAKTMKRTVNVYEAKTHFSQLLDRVMAGEEIVIGKAGKPVARLVPIAGTATTRLAGSAAGSITIAPDFDAPLPDEVLGGFEA